MDSGQHTYVYACACVPMYSPNPLGTYVHTHVPGGACSEEGRPYNLIIHHYRALVQKGEEYLQSMMSKAVRTVPFKWRYSVRMYVWIRCCTPNSPLGTYRELFVTAMNRANRPHYMVQAMCTKVDIRMYVRTCCIIAHVCLHTYLCTDTCNTQYNIHTVVCHTLVHRSIA